MLDPDMTEESLWAVLPTLPLGDLPLLLDHPVTKERHLVKLLERKDLPEDFLGNLSRHGKWVRSDRIKFCLVNHPNTPPANAMNMVKFLLWRDLNLTIRNFRIASEVRHRAESLLLQRLPAMATGEKVSLARTTVGRVLRALRNEKDPKVAAGLLSNPRLVEEDVLFLVSQGRTPAPVLEAVARDPKWAARAEVRVALLRNPRTPLQVAAGFVRTINSVDAQILSKDPKVPTALRRMLRTRLGGRR